MFCWVCWSVLTDEVWSLITPKEVNVRFMTVKILCLMEEAGLLSFIMDFFNLYFPLYYKYLVNSLQLFFKEICQLVSEIKG